MVGKMLIQRLSIISFKVLKIIVKVQVDFFLLDENIDHTEKKAQNDDFDRGRLGEINVVKFKNRSFCNFSKFLLQGFNELQSEGDIFL